MHPKSQTLLEVYIFMAKRNKTENIFYIDEGAFLNFNNFFIELYNTQEAKRPRIVPEKSINTSHISPERPSKNI